MHEKRIASRIHGVSMALVKKKGFGKAMLKSLIALVTIQALNKGNLDPI